MTRYALRKLKIMMHENGLKSILINNRSDFIASLFVYVRVGSVNEKLSQLGISHFLEHLMFKGSKNYSVNLMIRNIESMGGEINAATSKEYTMYYMNVQKDYLEKGIMMLGDTMQNPIFPQNEIDIERKVVIEEIRRYYDNPRAVLYEKFYETIYAESFLKNSVIGTSQIIANISREEICSYYKTHYIPAKMIVVVSGNFSESTVKKNINETFGRFEKSTLPAEPSLIEKVHNGKDVIEYGRMKVGQMLTGFLVTNINENDIYVANLAVSVLGVGRNSRLYRILYEKKHLVYSIGAFFSIGKGTGNICISSVFDSKNIEEIKSEIKNQIESIIDDGITKEELKRSKLVVKTDWYFSLETSFDIAELYGFWHLMGIPEFMIKFIKKIDVITIDDIRYFFKKHYLPEIISNVALLPKTRSYICR
ncbi:MAG: insulinase family protein [Endomicrobium sp.]|jgi:predicted Zn-dependent peptidase|nr:insulinase family protein [Endomicrobium sp.]